MNVRHAYVIESVTDEHALVIYSKRFCPNDATVIHFHRLHSTGERFVSDCIGKGCYTVLPQR